MLYLMLTEAQVEESRRKPHMADDREGVVDILMKEATDPQVCNQGDWHVWQVEDAGPGTEYLPERMADWIVSVVTVDSGEFRLDWFDTQVGSFPAVRRGRFVYEQGLGKTYGEGR